MNKNYTINDILKATNNINEDKIKLKNNTNNTKKNKLSKKNDILILDKIIEKNISFWILSEISFFSIPNIIWYFGGIYRKCMWKSGIKITIIIINPINKQKRFSIYLYIVQLDGVMAHYFF